MIRTLTFITAFIFSQSAFCQEVSRAKEEQAYAQAIEEYLRAIYKRDASVFDTLIVGRRPDFPAVSLPSRISNTTILLLTTKETDAKRKHNKKLVFVNIVGTVAEDVSEFIVVTFYPGYIHQYDCKIGLRYDSSGKTFKLDHIGFKNYAYR